MKRWKEIKEYECNCTECKTIRANERDKKEM